MVEEMEWRGITSEIKCPKCKTEYTIRMQVKKPKETTLYFDAIELPFKKKSWWERLIEMIKI